MKFRNFVPPLCVPLCPSLLLLLSLLVSSALPAVTVVGVSTDTVGVVDPLAVATTPAAAAAADTAVGATGTVSSVAENKQTLSDSQSFDLSWLGRNVRVGRNASVVTNKRNDINNATGSRDTFLGWIIVGLGVAMRLDLLSAILVCSADQWLWAIHVLASRLRFLFIFLMGRLTHVFVLSHLD